MINWGIIGTGNIANQFARQFNYKNANLFAVLSRNIGNAIDFSKCYNINEYYTDEDLFFKNPNIDIVYIATPHNTHYEYIKKALNSNKNVLAEKLIVLNAEQLKHCIKLAEDKNLFLAEAMTIHYMPLYRKIKNWISERNLGPLKMIQVNFGSYKKENERYFFRKDLAGGALFDIGVYALNLVRFFMTEKPTNVESFVKIHESGVDESSAIILKNDYDELATVSLTFRAKMPKRAVIAYERGYIEINDYPHANKATLTRPDFSKEELIIGDSGNRLGYEIEQISKLLEKNMKNKYLDYTLDVLEIMDELRKSWNLKYDGEEV